MMPQTLIAKIATAHHAANHPGVTPRPMFAGDDCEWTCPPPADVAQEKVVVEGTVALVKTRLGEKGN